MTFFIRQKVILNLTFCQKSLFLPKSRLFFITQHFVCSITISVRIDTKATILPITEYCCMLTYLSSSHDIFRFKSSTSSISELRQLSWLFVHFAELHPTSSVLPSPRGVLYIELCLVKNSIIYNIA